jgi:hypothetical protein
MKSNLSPNVLPSRVRTSWRHVPSLGATVFAAGRIDAMTPVLSRTQGDQGAVAKQASPPRGTG